jgi:hypothetical protein
VAETGARPSAARQTGTGGGATGGGVPLRATESSRSGREIVALCNSCRRVNFTIVCAQADCARGWRGAVSVVPRRLPEQSARPRHVQLPFTRICCRRWPWWRSCRRDRPPGGVQSPRGLLPVNSGPGTTFCVFVATRKTSAERVRTCASWSCVDKLAPPSPTTLEARVGMYSRTLAICYQFDDSRGDATTTAFSMHRQRRHASPPRRGSSLAGRFRGSDRSGAAARQPVRPRVNHLRDGLRGVAVDPPKLEGADRSETRRPREPQVRRDRRRLSGFTRGGFSRDAWTATRTGCGVSQTPPRVGRRNGPSSFAADVP